MTLDNRLRDGIHVNDVRPVNTPDSRDIMELVLKDFVRVLMLDNRLLDGRYFNDVRLENTPDSRDVMELEFKDFVYVHLRWIIDCGMADISTMRD